MVEMENRCWIVMLDHLTLPDIPQVVHARAQCRDSLLTVPPTDHTGTAKSMFYGYKYIVQL
jgi:hypothetical protein